MIEKKSFGVTQSGEPVDQITLVNAAGASATLINYGATLTHLRIIDKNHQLSDIVLGFDTLSEYEQHSAYFGATIGRVGNRIARGRFTLDKQNFALVSNNGENHLHGGFKGYDKRVWSAETATCEGPAVRFTLFDADGADGYPGNLKVTVIYTLTADSLKIQYFATTDKPTPINLTNHSYFNLKDGGRTDVLSHILQANADSYTPVHGNLIPTGEIAPVKGTAFDFTTAKPIGRDIKSTGGHPAGYDHNLVLRSSDGSLKKAVEVFEPQSGRRMETWTTEPAVQFYSGNFLGDGSKGKQGIIYNQYHAFCLETQHYPDSINQPNFPDTILRPGNVYKQITEYRFFIGEK